MNDPVALSTSPPRTAAAALSLVPTLPSKRAASGSPTSITAVAKRDRLADTPEDPVNHDCLSEAPLHPPKSDCSEDKTNETPLRVLAIHANATIPKRGTPMAAGFDIAAGEPGVVPAHGKAIIKTGLKIAVPEGFYGRIAPRSGLAVKKFIDVGAGVIDSDYRGELGIVLFNFSDDDFTVDVGDRVAQLILERISLADVVEVQSLEDTERGAGGFGSTGVKS